jgi:hypothetical protein
MIWLATFEPRTLTIKVHLYRSEKPDFPLSLEPLHCTKFSATLGKGFPPPRSHSTIPKHYIPITSEEACKLPPPGPVALHVCRQSRDIALERYELAFGGKLSTTCLGNKNVTDEWIAGGHGSPRIWVDFKRDVFVFRSSDMFRSGAKEVLKIQNMAWKADFRDPFVGVALWQVYRYWSLKTFLVYHGQMSEEAIEKLRRGFVEKLESSRPRNMMLPWVSPVPNMKMCKRFDCSCREHQL